MSEKAGGKKKLIPDDLKFEECRPITDKEWFQLRAAIRDMIIAQLGILPAILEQQRQEGGFYERQNHGTSISENEGPAGQNRT